MENNNKTTDKKDIKFEKMMQKFIKTSKEKNSEAVREHTKADRKKRKQNSNEQRKQRAKQNANK